MERSTCEVLNSEDKQKFTITTEWSDGIIKVTILKAGMIPLIGQSTIMRLREYTRSDIPEEQFLSDLKSELSGKEKEIYFSLTDARLVWKKKIWRKGAIELEPLTDIVTLADMSLEWLNEHSRLQNITISQMEKEKHRTKHMEDLVVKLKDMEESKKNMEDTLYKLFLSLLNSKKQKIRDLEAKLKNYENVTKRSEYENDTDNSADELGESSALYQNSKKESRILSHTDVSMSTISKPRRESSESEDEIVLKYVDSQEDVKNLNMEEDPESDLFS